MTNASTFQNHIEAFPAGPWAITVQPPPHRYVYQKRVQPKGWALTLREHGRQAFRP